MELAPGITVNGIKITPDEINNEVQYHPAPSLIDAKYESMKALVIRELLLQRATSLGLCQRDQAVKNPDDIINDLLDREIDVPEPDAETCRRYYDQNQKRFFTSPLFQVSHILYLASPDDDEAYEKAKRQAQDALIRLQEDPDLFEVIAQKESACSSSGEGGRLGQISKGQTLPAFEAALMAMKEGELSAAPVATEVGYHIIKVHEWAEGKQLPYETVADWIKDFLQQQSWRAAFNQYIQLLAGQAEISGFRLPQADSPLVQ